MLREESFRKVNMLEAPRAAIFHRFLDQLLKSVWIFFFPEIQKVLLFCMFSVGTKHRHAG